MNKFLFIFFFIVSFACYSAEPVSQGSVSGRGNSKAEAYANAIGRVPGGAVVYGVGYNGYSFPNSEGKQTGNYTCIIRWKRY
jgi:hypothetical protein